ncbi:hypothetical protein RintRC_7275 [Richelia intracellularis]|nr:hypothetical protein RintRC_7275 [Richelia intracellularis]
MSLLVQCYPPVFAGLQSKQKKLALHKCGIISLNFQRFFNSFKR